MDILLLTVPMGVLACCLAGWWWSNAREQRRIAQGYDNARERRRTTRPDEHEEGIPL